MIHIEVEQFQADFARYMDELAQGQEFVLCRDHQPVAEVKPIPPPPTKMRQLGMAKGLIEIPESFFDPLPPDILAAFNGEEPCCNKVTRPIGLGQDMGTIHSNCFDPLPPDILTGFTKET